MSLALQKYQSQSTLNFVRRVVAAMELIAPLKLADSSWDNVGLLVESPVELKHASILVTNDLTSKVLCEALDKQVGMIISYHPPWFKPSKSLLSSSGALNYINLCLSHGISIFSPHTALDAVSGGINDWILEAFGGNLLSSKPIISNSLPDSDGSTGFGRIAELREPISLHMAVDLIKQFLGLEALRLAVAVDSPPSSSLSIKTVAVCAGSGGSVFTKVKADLFVTGELSHHQILDLSDRCNSSVILTEHSNCERGFLRSRLVSRLKAELEQDGGENLIQVFFSETDKDPVTII